MPEFVVFFPADNEAEWAAVIGALAERGLMTPAGDLTAEGVALRAELERRTDELALAAYASLADAEVARLIDVLTPLTQAVVAMGHIPATTPMAMRATTITVAIDPMITTINAGVFLKPAFLD